VDGVLVGSVVESTDGKEDGATVGNVLGKAEGDK